MSQAEHYVHAARLLGWRFSSAHDGYINDKHRDPKVFGSAGYIVMPDCEDACFFDGIETDEQARQFVYEQAAA